MDKDFTNLGKLTPDEIVDRSKGVSDIIPGHTWCSGDDYLLSVKRVCAELKAARAEIERLRPMADRAAASDIELSMIRGMDKTELFEDMFEALQALYDVQNDAPLERNRHRWEAAMKKADSALAKAYMILDKELDANLQITKAKGE